MLLPCPCSQRVRCGYLGELLGKKTILSGPILVTWALERDGDPAGHWSRPALETRRWIYQSINEAYNTKKCLEINNIMPNKGHLTSAPRNHGKIIGTNIIVIMATFGSFVGKTYEKTG